MLIYFKHKRESLLFNIFIIFSFLCLSIFNVFLLYKLHRIPLGDDMWFHWQRILELVKSNSILPQFAFNSFSNSGSAVFTMYPYLLLYPFALFFKIFKSIYLTTVFIVTLNTFLSLIISFYCSKSYSNKWILSYLFALMYSLSFPLFLNSVKSYAIGMNYSFIFMPLVIFGFIYWIKYGKWIMLSIGMSMIIYSEVIMAIATPFFLMIMFLLNLRHVNLRKIISLGKAIILTLLTTSLFWIPAIKLFLFNKISTAWKVRGNNGVDIPKVIYSSISTYPIKEDLTNLNSYLITIYALLGVIIGWICFNHMPKILKQLYIMSVCILLFCSNLCPWALFNRTPIANIQITWRLYLIPQVILTYVFAYFVCNHKYKINNKWIVVFSMIFLIMGNEISYESTYLSKIGHQCVNNHLLYTSPNVEATDYYPIKSIPFKHDVQDHKIFTNTNKVIGLKSLGNGHYIFYTNKKYKTLTLPILYYNNINYLCHINKKVYNVSPNAHQLMIIHNINKGKNYLNLSTPLYNNKTLIISRIGTLLSIIIYLILIFRLILNKNNVHVS